MPIIIFCSAVIISVAYAFLILKILAAWTKQPEYIAPDSPVAVTSSYTVVIPARNEEANIEACLLSLTGSLFFNQYQTDIIVVDDFSTDRTSDIVKALDIEQVQLIRMSEHFETGDMSGKKQALIKASEAVSSDYIIQLDADLVVHEAYLHTVISYLEAHRPDFLAGPVRISTDKDSCFESFQCLDYAGMLAVTQAGLYTDSWYMANGANMSYKRHLARYGNETHASGDDVYAIQYARSQGAAIHFLKSRSAMVTTVAISELKAFLSQRIRWSTKNRSMKGVGMQYMMGLSFLNTVLIFVLAGLALTFSHTLIILALLNNLMVAVMLDYLLLKEVVPFFNADRQMRHFWCAKAMHGAYILCVGALAIFIKKYRWKGRKVK